MTLFSAWKRTLQSSLSSMYFIIKASIVFFQFPSTSSRASCFTLAVFHFLLDLWRPCERALWHHQPFDIYPSCTLCFQDRWKLWIQTSYWLLVVIATANSLNLRCLFWEKCSIIPCFLLFWVWRNLYVEYRVSFWLILAKRTICRSWHLNFARFSFGWVDGNCTWPGECCFPFGLILWIQSYTSKHSILRNLLIFLS